MGGTPVVNGCLSYDERKTGPSPITREFSWDGDFDEVGVGAGVPIIYSTRVRLDRHNVVAQLLGLPLK
jgi:hypothetical protein